MLTPQLMGTMDDAHLVAALRAEFDPLTSTALEIELLKRFERMLDEKRDDEPFDDARDDEPFDDALEDTFIEHEQLPEVIKVLSEFNAADIAILRQKLERADKFYDIANDAGDVITRLNDLINTTL